jgi:hypothetical protein
MLISAAAVVGTLGGWVGLAANDGAASAAQAQAQAPIISTTQMQQTSAQGALDARHVGDAPAVPLAMTRSSR